MIHVIAKNAQKCLFLRGLASTEYYSFNLCLPHERELIPHFVFIFIPVSTSAIFNILVELQSSFF